MDQDRLALLALHLLPRVGSFTVKQLISYCGDASTVFKTPARQLLRIPGIGKGIVESVHRSDSFRRAEKELAQAEKLGIRLLFHTDDNFPFRLKQINDAPGLIYYHGSFDLNSSKVIAIVGTRKATEYGLRLTAELIHQLKSHAPLVISGLAYGIDAQAHRCSLKEGLPTLAVMAGGINYIYPAAHRELSRAIRNSGGLVTENGLSSIPDATKFPARNRIIAGMADAVIVVEAATRGGALITAEIANDYNRDVLAFPGSLDQPMSVGCNRLIKRHRAHLLTDVGDIEYILNWSTTTQSPATTKEPLPALEDAEQKLVALITTQSGQMHIDRISWCSGFSINQVASLLLQLEFKNVIRSLPGKMYAINQKFL